MALNEVFREADRLSLPVPAGTVSGSPVRVGAYATGLNGVTQTDEGAMYRSGSARALAAGSIATSNADGFATVWLKGAFKLAVSTATALAIGDPVYITSSNTLTPSASGNQLFGHALTAKGTTAGVLVTVRIAN